MYVTFVHYVFIALILAAHDIIYYFMEMRDFAVFVYIEFEHTDISHAVGLCGCATEYGRVKMTINCFVVNRFLVIDR